MTYRYLVKRINRRSCSAANNCGRPPASQGWAAGGHHSLAVLHGHSRQNRRHWRDRHPSHLLLSSAPALCRVQREGKKFLSSRLKTSALSHYIQKLLSSSARLARRP